jgi:hypothetical protein
MASRDGWSSALDAAAGRLPDIDRLRSRRLFIVEPRFRSVQFFMSPETKAWKRCEPWMGITVDLNTGQVHGVVDDRDHRESAIGSSNRPLEWRPGVPVVSIDPSAAFGKSLRMWLPRTAGSVDASQGILPGNNVLTARNAGISVGEVAGPFPFGDAVNSARLMQLLDICSRRSYAATWPIFCLFYSGTTECPTNHEAD